MAQGNEKYMAVIRNGTADDIDYFVRAGLKYSELMGFDFDEEIYRQNVLMLLDAPIFICKVIPNKAHCAMMLTPSLFGKDVIAKTVSTWGRGGLKCFRKAMAEAKEKGASKIIADANLSPDIAKFYVSIGMKEQDTNYMGDL